MPVLEAKDNLYTMETLLEIVRCLSTSELHEKLVVFTHPTSQLSKTGKILASFIGYEYAFRESMSKRTPDAVNYQIVEYLAKLPDVKITSKYRCRLDTIPGLNKYLYLCREKVYKHQKEVLSRTLGSSEYLDSLERETQMGMPSVFEEGTTDCGDYVSSSIDRTTSRAKTALDSVVDSGITDAFSKLSETIQGKQKEDSQFLAYSK